MAIRRLLTDNGGLSIENVRFSYSSADTSAPFNLVCAAFYAPRGVVTFVVGGNGTGKTTLLNLASGALLAATGSVTVDGMEVGEWRKLRPGRGIARIDASIPHLLIDRLLVADHLVFAMQVRREARIPLFGRSATATRAAAGYLDDLGIPSLAPLLNNRVRQLSSGQRQLLSIAMALAGSTGVLLSDESTANLDAANAQLFFSLLRRRAEHSGTVVVAVVHDLSLVSAIAERCYATTRDGSVEEIGLDSMGQPERLRALSQAITRISESPD